MSEQLEECLERVNTLLGPAVGRLLDGAAQLGIDMAPLQPVAESLMREAQELGAAHRPH